MPEQALLDKASSRFYIKMGAGTILFFICLFLLVSCDRPTDISSADKEATQEKNITSILSKGLTRGNHTYIPLENMGAELNTKAEEILEILKRFETEHPELEVTSWRLENRHTSYNINAKIYGIWIDHKPKH